MNCLFLNPPRRDTTVMVKEGRCMQRKGAWGYIMSPLSMVVMATLLRDHGHTVGVIDCPAVEDTFSAMLAEVARISPDLVFINTATPTIYDDIFAAGCIKQQSTHPVKTVLFGIHPSCRYTDLLLPENGVDFCIIGEPEYTARDLAAALRDGDGTKLVAGLAFLDDKGELVVTGPRTPISNLDELPVPDWSLIDTGNYRLPLNNRRFLLANTNRGCPYRCTFCNAYAYYGRVPRRRSVQHIMKELHNNVEKFGVTDFMFWAEEFILDKAFVLELCREITGAGLKIRWVCNSRVDAADEETMNAISSAGCWNIAFGIESGDQDILTRINKQTTLEQIRFAVTAAKHAGLQVTGHVIIGLPGDSRTTISNTEKFINSLELDFVQYYCAMPYPGTQLYDEAVSRGWVTTTDWHRWEHNFSILDYEHLKSAEIMKLRRKLMLRWYLTPKRLLNILKNNIGQSSDLFALIARTWGFLRWM